MGHRCHILLKGSYYQTSFDNFTHRAPPVETGDRNGAKMYEINSIEVNVQNTLIICTNNTKDAIRILF